MTLAEKIKLARTKSGMTQKEVASRMEISQQAYGQYESGKREPKPETIARIANALGVTRYELENPRDTTGCEFAEALRENTENDNTFFGKNVSNVIMSIYDAFKSEEEEPSETLEKTVRVTELYVKTIHALSSMNDTGLDAVIENVVKELDWNQKKEVVCSCMALQGTDIEKVYLMTKSIEEMSKMPQYQKEPIPDSPAESPSNK